MFKSGKRSRPLFWFYILLSYVLIQFVWWSYLMMNLNHEMVLLKNEVNLLKQESAEEIIARGNELNALLRKRRLMIVGEGAVFIGLLMAGAYQIQKTFKKEKALNEQQKNFLLSVTHELKSPIASAKLQLQTLIRHELPRDKQKEIILNAINDTDRLNTLVENILIAAKIENNVYLLHKEKQNISALITGIVHSSLQSFNCKHKVQLDVEPDVWLEVDAVSFPSIVINLFENAIKYSPEGSAIVVRLSHEKGKIVFAVADQGIGISDEEKKNIFQKFYRVGSEETRKTKGTGLGLFIVEYIVSQHGATLVVKNNTPRGSIFEVVFPNS